jgi:cytochrome c oxidase subunit 3
MSITLSSFLAQQRKFQQAHPYHMVSPSPWPIFLSFSLLNLALGVVMYMHSFFLGKELLQLGLFLTVGGMVLWFRDVITEGTYEGHHTLQVQDGLIIGVILFIISEIFAFLSVFWAYLYSSLSPAIEIGGVWPPAAIVPLNPIGIPLLNTIILVTTGGLITYGHHALIGLRKIQALKGTFYTIFLGIVFTLLQAYEYFTASFTIADSVFGTVFYASTGLHGFHVVIGTLFLLVGFIRILNNHFTNTHHVGLETGILYWHKNITSYRNAL